MIKKTALWIVYFLVCGAVIAAGIKEGAKHKWCDECPIAFHK